MDSYLEILPVPWWRSKLGPGHASRTGTRAWDVQSDPWVSRMTTASPSVTGCSAE